MAPKDAEDWYYKGLILIDQKKYDEAIKCFDRTIEANPSFADAYYYKGAALNSQGKKDEAERCIGKFLELKSLLPITGPIPNITQIPKPPIVPEKSKPHLKAERLNSRYDEVWLQRGAYFVMLRHMNREG
jgi:tetratricopeptide (TPR) repeat protein